MNEPTTSTEEGSVSWSWGRRQRNTFEKVCLRSEDCRAGEEDEEEKDSEALVFCVLLPNKLPILCNIVCQCRLKLRRGSRVAQGFLFDYFKNVAIRTNPEPNSFRAFAMTSERIGAESRKLEKVRVLSEYLRTLPAEASAWAATWFSGHPFPATQARALQVGGATLVNALRLAAGVDQTEVHRVYDQSSDLGTTAAELFAQRAVAASLTLDEVHLFFHELHRARGPLGKVPRLRTFLERCTALEAKYVLKIITGDLRIGLKEGLVEEAVAVAYAQPLREVQQAHLLLGDVGATARLAAEGRLSEATLVAFRPVKFMLASPEPTAAAVWERVREKTEWLEDKYDGIRCQMHKAGRRVAMYSRDLKEITGTFLELADAAHRLGADAVFDGEVIAIRGERVLPFAELQKRLGRREADLFLHEEVPIRYVVFDLLWLNGEMLLSKPLRERRRLLESVQPLPSCIRVAPLFAAGSAAEIEAAFEAARGRGNEGLMIKDPASAYTPGSRGLAWLKLKKALATLDCVVVGAEYGHGKRSHVLSDYTFAVRDEATGELKTIGKAYTGLTDAEILGLTRHFLQVATRRSGRYFEVPPDTVLEIAFDRLQPSNRHNSGLAMRFPRIVRLRTDKSANEIDTLATARRIAKVQSREVGEGGP